jgi:two-component system cell cycle sensor histidine kinase/response regulator CckA
VGSRFVLALPVHEAPGALRDDTVRDESHERPAPAARSVLVVDDESAVALATSRLIQRLGWVTHVASSGVEALELLERGTPVTLVLTDQAMPAMTGSELVARVRARHPHVGCIVMSGGAGAFAETSPRAKVPFLPKPFTVDELAEILDRVARELASAARAAQ